MPNVSKGTIDVYVPELWLTEVQKARETNLVAANRFFDVSGFGEVKKKGDVLHIPKLSNYTAGDKTANTELPSSATTETEFTLTINKHKGLRIPVEDFAAVQSAYDMMSLYTGRIGYALAKALDTDLLALYSGLAQTVGATASTDGGISDTNIVRAIQKLDRAEAPRDGRSIIIDSFGMEDMRLIDKFTRYDAVGQANAITNGQFGTIYGIPVYISENVQTTSVIGGTLSRGLVVHKEAFAFAQQKSPSIETWRNGPQLADELIGQSIYGVAEYRDDHGVVLSYPQ
jgi:N4-gp56 family major capsid protein